MGQNDNATKNKSNKLEEALYMANNNNNNSNQLAVPQAKAGLNRLKMETANEVGITNYESIDKGNLTSRQNGYVGGFMTKKMVEAWERDHANG